ncbi:MAG: hypothetical protein ACLR5I_15380 [Odoribacter splanchnicus]
MQGFDYVRGHEYELEVRKRHLPIHRLTARI